jgi:hypothetical protein
VYKKDANPRQTTAFLTRAKIVKKITRTVTWSFPLRCLAKVYKET